MNILLSTQETPSSGAAGFLAASAASGENPGGERFTAAFRQEMGNGDSPAAADSDSRTGNSSAAASPAGKPSDQAANGSDKGGKTLPSALQLLAAATGKAAEADKATAEMSSAEGSDALLQKDSRAGTADSDKDSIVVKTGTDKAASADIQSLLSQGLAGNSKDKQDTAPGKAGSLSSKAEADSTTEAALLSTSVVQPQPARAEQQAGNPLTLSNPAAESGDTRELLISSPDSLNPLPEEENSNELTLRAPVTGIAANSDTTPPAQANVTALQAAVKQAVAGGERNSLPGEQHTQQQTALPVSGQSEDSNTAGNRKDTTGATYGTLMNKATASSQQEAVTPKSDSMSKLFAEMQQSRFNLGERSADGSLGAAALQPQKVIAPEVPNSNAAISALNSAVNIAEPLSNAGPLSSTSGSQSASFVMHPELQPGSEAWKEDIGTKITWLSQQKISKAEITLRPADLGALDITIHNDDDKITVSIVTRNDAAREMLEGSLPRLAELLKNSGLALEQGSVSQQQAGQGEQSGDSDSRNTAGGTHGQDQEPEQQSQLRRATVQHDGNIDQYV